MNHKTFHADLELKPHQRSYRMLEFRPQSLEDGIYISLTASSAQRTSEKAFATDRFSAKMS